MTFVSTDKPAARRWWPSRRMLRRHMTAYLFLLPALICLVIVSFVPMFQGIITSFEAFSLFRPGRRLAVGFDQYEMLFNDPIFWRSFWQSWYFAIASVVLQCALGLAAALLLNQNIYFRGFFRGLVLIPWVVPGSLAAMMFGLLFTSTGLVNTLLANLGLVQLGVIDAFHPWLSDPNTSMPTIIITNTWKGFPFFAVMFLAALQGIPKDYYEAATIDGATRWQAFSNITLPSLAPTIMITTLLGTIWTFNSIELIYILTSGGPYFSTMTLAMFAYNQGFGRGNIGYASAAGVVILVLMAIITVIYLASYRKSGR